MSLEQQPPNAVPLTVPPVLQGQPAPAPAPVYIVVQGRASADRYSALRNAMAKKTTLGLAGAQMAIGIILFTLEIVLTATGARYTFGTGFWAGSLYCLTGGIGLVTAHKPSYCM